MFPRLRLSRLHKNGAEAGGGNTASPANSDSASVSCLTWESLPVIPLRLLYRWISINRRRSIDEVKVHLADERMSTVHETSLGEMNTHEKRWRRLAGTHDLQTKAHNASVARSSLSRSMIVSVNSGGKQMRWGEISHWQEIWCFVVRNTVVFRP
jgi:hypothetical protein